jgi:hypothetical protein
MAAFSRRILLNTNCLCKYRHENIIAYDNYKTDSYGGTSSSVKWLEMDLRSVQTESKFYVKPDFFYEKV